MSLLQFAASHNVRKDVHNSAGSVNYTCKHVECIKTRLYTDNASLTNDVSYQGKDRFDTISEHIKTK